MKIKINQMDDEILKVSVVENLKEAWRNIEATDLEFVKGKTLDFCKNQVLKKCYCRGCGFIRTEEI